LRIFSYRNKRIAKTALLVLAGVLSLLIILCVGRFLYLQRYLVYGDGSVRLDYEQDLQSEGTKHEVSDPRDFPLHIITPEDGSGVTGPVDDSIKPLTGYFVTTNMLQNVPNVQTALEELEQQPRVILFEMKSIFGNFYYQSALFGQYTANADIPAVKALVEQMQENGAYVIAKVPAFSDINFALANQSCGLPLSSGALWMDSNGCYWLDPMDDEVLNYLTAIAAELRELGFDEIVFDGFTMPDSEKIIYPTEFTREEYTAQAAQTLMESLSELPVRVSFGSTSPLMATIGERIYVSGVEGSAVLATVEALSAEMENPAAQIVFLTESRDTRFEQYSVLRPLIESND
jgi:hypothetical protein